MSLRDVERRSSREAVTARVDALDGLRGWLALVVAFSHARVILYPGADSFGSLLAADLAVRIFFVHSGFVLSLKYFRSRDRRWPQVMFIRRPLRLGLPVLAAALAGWGFVRLWRPGSHQLSLITGGRVSTIPLMDMSLRDVAQQGLIDPLLRGRSVIPGAWWTMPIELYCSLALLALLVLAAGLPIVARRVGLAAYVVVVLAVVVSNRTAPPIIFRSFEGALNLLVLSSVAFVLGAALARVWADDSGRIPRLVDRHRFAALAITALALGVGVFPSTVLPLVLHNRSALQLAVISASAILVTAVLAWSFPKRVFQAPLSAWLGRVSFAVYLVHPAVMETVMARSTVRLVEEGAPRGFASLAAFALAMAIIAALAQILTMTADRVALNLGKESLYRRLGLRP